MAVCGRAGVRLAAVSRGPISADEIAAKGSEGRCGCRANRGGPSKDGGRGGAEERGGAFLLGTEVDRSEEVFCAKGQIIGVTSRLFCRPTLPFARDGRVADGGRDGAKILVLAENAGLIQMHRGPVIQARFCGEVSDP